MLIIFHSTSLTGVHLHKAEQPLQGMELKENKAKIKNIYKETDWRMPKDSSNLLTLRIEAI